MNARPTPPVILSVPVGAAVDLDALRREFGCTIIQNNWVPSSRPIHGVLHITRAHPDELLDWGHTQFITRGWPTPAGQRGRVAEALLNWVIALGLVVLIGAAWQLDAWPVPDLGYAEESARADALLDEQWVARWKAQQRARLARAAAAACGGPESRWKPLDDNRVQCATRRGRETIITALQ